MSEHTHYEEVNDRLKEIVEAVSDESLPLDDALDLFEEAVKLGMEASTKLEEDMAARDAQAEAEEAAADAALDVEVDGIGIDMQASSEVASVAFDNESDVVIDNAAPSLQEDAPTASAEEVG